MTMRLAVLILPLAAAVLLAACSREEEPVANKFERQAAEIQNKARAFEAQVENEVSAAEARLENQVDTLMNSLDQGNIGRTETEAETKAEENSGE
jgi:outer membrane biogenesis lipoprotein LolB